MERSLQPDVRPLLGDRLQSGGLRAALFHRYHYRSYHYHHQYRQYHHRSYHRYQYHQRDHRYHHHRSYHYHHAIVMTTLAGMRSSRLEVLGLVEGVGGAAA